MLGFNGPLNLTIEDFIRGDLPSKLLPICLGGLADL
jgi:hypothetical protein